MTFYRLYRNILPSSPEHFSIFTYTRIISTATIESLGALASRLHAHGKHGDPGTRQLVMRVMNCVCAPLFAFITR